MEKDLEHFKEFVEKRCRETHARSGTIPKRDLKHHSPQSQYIRSKQIDRRTKCKQKFHVDWYVCDHGNFGCSDCLDLRITPKIIIELKDTTGAIAMTDRGRVQGTSYMNAIGTNGQR